MNKLLPLSNSLSEVDSQKEVRATTGKTAAVVIELISYFSICTMRAETAFDANSDVGAAVEKSIRPLVWQILLEIQVRRSPKLHTVHVRLHFHNLNYY